MDGESGSFTFKNEVSSQKVSQLVYQDVIDVATLCLMDEEEKRYTQYISNPDIRSWYDLLRQLYLI